MIKKLVNTILTFTFLAVIAEAAPVSPQSAGSQAAAEKVPSSEMIGFQEWKQNRVLDARETLIKFKSPQHLKQADGAIPSENSQENVENTGETPGQAVEKPEVGLNSQTTTDKQNLADSLPKPGSVSAEKPSGPQTPEEQHIAEVVAARETEKLRQLEFNLEIAQSLTIHDYFALYLKNKSKAQMAEAIKKLSPEEVSELLLAYRKALYGLPPVEQQSEVSSQKSL